MNPPAHFAPWWGTFITFPRLMPVIQGHDFICAFPLSFRIGFDYRTTLGSVGAMILTGIRRLVEVPIQPARGD